jgi:hypothetical protein
MKQKIFDALKAKFTGVSDNVLNRIAEKLAKTVTTEDGVQPAVDGVTFQQVIDGEADRRVTEATQTAVTNYEKKHGLKDGQKAQEGGLTDGEDPDKNKQKPTTGANGELTLEAITAAINTANKPLLDRIAAIETGKVSETRKQKLDTIIGKLPENLRKPYGRINLTEMSEDDFNSFLTETTTEVESVAGDISVKGSVLQPPKLGGGGISKKEPTKEETEEVLKGLI